MDNTKQTEIPQEIRVYLEALIQDAGEVSLDDQMKSGMVNELYIQLDSFINAIIVDHLPTEYLDEFIKLNEDKKNKEEIEAFLKKNIPNAQQVFTKAFENFRKLYP